jgi:hypothetical protein
VSLGLYLLYHVELYHPRFNPCFLAASPGLIETCICVMDGFCTFQIGA